MNTSWSIALTLSITILGLWLEATLAKALQPVLQTNLTEGQQGHNRTSHICEPLALSACSSLGLYSHVLLPNSFGHSSQHEVSRALNKFTPMLRTAGCGEWLSVLLCLTYAPPCPPPTPLGIKGSKGEKRRKKKNRGAGAMGSIPAAPACRQLCASAWNGCWRHLDKMGMQWPHALDCEMLPIGVEEDGMECIMRKGKLVNHTGILTALKSSKSATQKADVQKSRDKKPKVVAKENFTSNKSPTALQKQPNKSRGKIMKVTKEVTKQIKKPQNRTRVNTTTPASNSSHMATKLARLGKKTKQLKARRYNIREKGDSTLFQGWVDIQGQGAANDYCRVIGSGIKHRFLSCALAGGTGQDHTYVSKQGFDVGHSHTWFMRDMDKDGRDDYCRCIGHGLSSKIACMKAGKYGFFGSPLQAGSEFTFYIKSRKSCHGKPVNPVLGITL